MIRFTLGHLAFLMILGCSGGERLEIADVNTRNAIAKANELETKVQDLEDRIEELEARLPER